MIIIRMFKRAVVLLCIIMSVLSFSGCSENEERSFVSITAEEAKEIIETQSNYIILDVRTQEEFDEGHIKGATLIPDTQISLFAEELLPDKDQQILVYCRTGRRSKNASKELVDMGYKNIKEFGGIVDWPYETVTE